MVNTGELLFDTVAEYDAEIVIVRDSIRRQMMIGSSSMNNSGGSQRAMTEVEFKNSVDFLARLRKERSLLIPSACGSANFLQISAAW